MSAEHSPLPWTLVADRSRDSVEDIVSADGQHALCFGHGYDDHTFISIADAEFICKAVNSYAVMVNALTQFLDVYLALANSGDCGNWNPEDEPHVIAARAALAIAKGEA